MRSVDAIYDYYAEDLYDYCLTFLEPEPAADALHDALLVALAWHNHLEARDQFGLWLYALTRNECLRVLRRSGAGMVAHGAHSGDAVSRRTGDLEKDQLREVHDLIHRHAFDAKEIAAVLGVPGSRAQALCDRTDRLFGRRRGPAPSRVQPRTPAPPELRARVLASAKAPSRVAYRGDLAQPRQRTGYPVPLDRIDAFRRRRTLRMVGIAAAVLAVVAAAFVVPTNSRKNVVGLLNSSRPASELSGSPLDAVTPTPTGSASPAPPRWQPVPSGDSPTSTTGPISGVGGKCMEVADAAGAAGSTVQLFQCNRRPSQVWTASSDGTVRAFGKCLAIRNGGTTDGSEIQIAACDGTPGQQWKGQRNGALLNPGSKKCLEAPTLNASDATVLVLWRCTGSDQQYWALPS